MEAAPEGVRRQVTITGPHGVSTNVWGAGEGGRDGEEKGVGLG